jgi:hypothetical protein
LSQLLHSGADLRIKPGATGIEMPYDLRAHAPQ